MYTDVMVDIESLDIVDTAVVLSIGAVKFNPYEIDSYDSLEQDDSRCFYGVLNIQEQINKHRTISASTLKWWMEQSVLAKRVFQEKQYPCTDVLAAFNKFCVGTSHLWGNGATFDNSILRSLWRDCEVEFPYPFWADMDLRTAKRIAGNPKIEVPGGVAHNALDDAKKQVLLLQHYLNDPVATTKSA